MEQLNIHVLLLAIRGLSHEIKVRALAQKLGISYSTFARCKNGVWPRSITFEAMRTTLDEYAVALFDKDRDALARSLLLNIKSQGIDTSVLAQTLEACGYDTFVMDLLAAAASYSPPADEPVAPAMLTPEDAAPNKALDAPSTEVQEPDAQGRPAQATDEVSNQAFPVRRQDLPFLLPIAAILLIGMLPVSLGEFLGWISSHWSAFCAISLLIALAPMLTGIFVDSPIAWHAYKKLHPEATLTLRGFAHVAKYGAEQGNVPGAGRYDLTLRYLAHQPLCNTCGMLCYVSLCALALSLPGFLTFFQGHAWMEWLKVAVTAAFFIALGQAFQLAGRVPGHPGLQTAERPDNHDLTRVHVWANVAHLVWTISFITVLLVGLVAYSIVRFRTMPAPMLLASPLLHGIAFFVVSCMSPYAIRNHATCVGTLVSGVGTLAGGFSALALVCFTPSPGTVTVVAVSVAGVLLTFAWRRRQLANGERLWLERYGNTVAYNITILSVIGVLVAFGLATSTFG